MSLNGRRIEPALESEWNIVAESAARTRRLPGPWYARPVVVGVVAFLALLIIKFDTLSEPPAWDAAMSVHPAAITLAETGFDYPASLSSPGYAEGGPNTHSLSLYTAFAAIAYWLFTPATALAVLHISTFVLGALTCVGLVRFARHFLSPGQAVWAVAAAMSTPVVLTQFGMVYLEAPVLAATTWALVAAIERRWIATAGFSLLATAVKPSGAITAAALALFFLVRGERKGKPLLILLASGVMLSAVVLASPNLGKPSYETANFILKLSAQYLIAVPDLAALLIFATAASWGLIAAKRSQLSSDIGLMWLVFAVAYLVFYMALASASFTILPRYYILIAPLAVVTILVTVGERLGTFAFGAATMSILLLASINFNGSAYPLRSITNFALIERSDSYDELLALQVAATGSICELANKAPVWYAKPDLYRLNYPEMGYSSCAEPGRAFVQESTTGVDELPDELYVAFGYPWLGGATLQRLVAEAEASSHWSVTVAETIEVGRFRQDIYRLIRSP